VNADLIARDRLRRVKLRLGEKAQALRAYSRPGDRAYTFTLSVTIGEYTN
jgi:hypothetical protein